MQQEIKAGRQASIHWRSLKIEPAKAGYRVSEDARICKGRSCAECAARFLAMAMLFAGWFVWFIFPSLGELSPIWSSLMLSTAFAGTGFGLLVFSGRGFRKAVELDRKKRELQLMTLNSGDKQTVKGRIPMRNIESIYVRRVEGKDSGASLYIRIQGQDDAPCAIRGSARELEELHSRFSRDISEALGRRVTPSRPILPPKSIAWANGQPVKMRPPRPANLIRPARRQAANRRA